MEYADYLLKDSDEYNKYKEFDEVSSPDNYVSSFNEALSIEQDNDIIKEICQKLAGNLERISKLKENNIKKKESCGYLHFWLYHTIDNKFKNHGNFESITKKIINGGMNFNDIISNKDCSIRFSSNINLEKWIEGKHLHDYFKNFDFISKTYSPKSEKCQEYSNYIKRINELYIIHKTQYYMSKSFYRNLYSNDKYNPSNLLSNFKCEDKNNAKDLMEVQTTDLTGTFESHISFPKSRLQHTQENNTTVGSNPYSTVGFTTLGSWIRGKIWKNHINIDNIDNISNKPLEVHSEYMGINNSTRKFHVSYNPV
ncbi:PIR Superfamily Protein [Plasmodium ovale wallikeri]|uniref:PIR Superfamily Protein n=1 Tax=Plasmodium ovale wallikeri TaxID=864142 RepID=A0A1A9AJE2_PLAOA|nr:PIR Superfamily Protein [Plasmodium ovale wallikeri]SBT56301.1 PIR Superfamily Protein [Plasmodium ovale wallikeri]